MDENTAPAVEVDDAAAVPAEVEATVADDADAAEQHESADDAAVEAADADAADAA